MGYVLASVAIACAGGLLGLARVRLRSLRRLPEAAPRRRISELERGRFRVSGRVVSVKSTRSAIDGVPCVYLEHAEYKPLGVWAGPVMKELGRYSCAHPFYIDDGTGRLAVDPGCVAVDAVTVVEDGGLCAERRLRVGEHVELIASFARGAISGSEGPYRALPSTWHPTADAAGLPTLSYRTEPGMVKPLDDVTTFLQGAGALMLLLTALLSALALL